MANMKIREVGEKYRPTVEIVKVKKGRATVINVNGNYYRLDLDTTEKEAKAQKLPDVDKRHRLKQMGRI